MDYQAQKIEKKWQRIWERRKTFQVNLKKAKKPYYNLMMFPYPSADGLHVGNVYAFTGSDIHGRFRKMQACDVFEPMGFDAFGIHSENFAIQKKIHPKVLIQKNVNNFRRQLKNLGCLFDWRYEVDTTKPNYYKWTQWLFLQLFKVGLAGRKKAPVDWCSSCKTVLADEQVINGKCERCDTEVIQKELEQWFFKITKYAERLLKNLDWIDWSERTKIAQRNWIGKSEDTEILFPIKDSNIKIPIVTTRADTIFGATFLALAPELELVEKLKEKIKNWAEVEQYKKKVDRKSDFERGLATREKTGVQLKGIVAINPVNKKEIPIYLADYVLATYGTGAIMAVPGHDDRDFEFAKKFHLSIISVVEKPLQPGILSIYVYNYDDSLIAQSLREIGIPKEYWTPVLRKYDVEVERTEEVIQILKQAEIGSPEQYRAIRQGQSFALETNPAAIDFGMVYSGDGVHINSDFLNGLNTEDAINKIVKWLSKRKLGRRTVHYHLRDWLISRQRYWGPPIPIIYCQKCGIVPVPEKDLPIKLPYVKNFRPTGGGRSPLASFSNFIKTKCPKCQGPGQRETDVSDTFLDSSWYFFRYPSANLMNSAFDKKLTKKWLPVDMYIGGQEHAVLHLLYTRFITMVLKDSGFINFEEPFKKFRAHGLLTKEGAKMSKSKGNVVNPDDYYRKYGADTLRMYLMFLGPFSEGGDWQDRGIMGIYRFLDKVWRLKSKIDNSPKSRALKLRAESILNRLIHRTIKKVTEDIENLRYNTAISALMILVNEMEKQNQLSISSYQLLLKLLAPFAPYITEELWRQLGNKNSVHNQSWPKYNSKLIKEDRIILIIQVNGKVRDKIEVEADISEEKAKDLAVSQKKIKNWLGDGKIKKVIFVPGKLINIVI